MRPTAFLFALALAACASEPELFGPKPGQATIGGEIVSVPWAARQPSFDQVMAAYPPAAEDLEVEGSASLLCTITPRYTLDCTIESESPAGYGFGEAALRIAQHYIVRRDYPGVSEGARVRVPLNFVLP